MIENPVLHRELALRLRVRQPKPVLLGIGILSVVLIGCLYWYIGVNWLLADADPEVGGNVWKALVGIQFTIICLITPVIAANAITQEKEQQTWEMLLFTPLRPAEIILGKLAARAVLFSGVLIVFLPLMMISWAHSALVGVSSSTGVSLARFLLVYLVMGLDILFFATVGMMMSWLVKRTLYAIVLSYTIVIGGLCLGTLLLTGLVEIVLNDSFALEKSPLMWLNPIVQVTWAISSGADSEGVLYLAFGMLAYGALTILMLWRMIAGFQRYASD